MTIDAALLLLFILFLANYWATRSVLYPPVIFCGIWLLDLLLYRMDLIEIDPISPTTVVIVSLGAVIFSLGSGLGLLVPKNLIESRFVVTRFPPRNRLVKPLVLIFLAFGPPLLFSAVLSMAGGGGVEGSILAQARSNGVAASNESIQAPGFSFLPYFVSWSCFAAFLFLIEKRDKAFWLMAWIAFVSAVLTTGRVPILQLMSGLTCIHLMKTNQVRFWSAMKVARIPILLFLGLYIGLIFVNKGSQADFYGGGVGEIILVLVVSYIIGPTVAFGYFLDHLPEYTPAPNHTFKFFLGIASHLHLVSFEGLPLYSTCTPMFHIR